MSLIAVEGIYENGKIELKEIPSEIHRARVVVTFLPEETDTEEAAARRREAGERLIASMKQGLDFGGEKFNRAEIYEERMQELERRMG